MYGLTISNNPASSGGGLYFEPAPTDVVLVINSTVSGNASGLGTGILLANFTHSNNVTLNVNSCTIANNPGAGGGIMGYALGASQQATVSLTSTILANNGPPNLGQFPAAGIVQFVCGGYNVATDAPAALTHAGDQVNTDPNLKPLADNGGPTRTHALPYVSVALDHGKSPLRSTDQRSFPRQRDLPTIDAPPGGEGSDVGAFEWSDLNGNGAEDSVEIFDNGFED
jgi:hypothetical protein